MESTPVNSIAAKKAALAVSGYSKVYKRHLNFKLAHVRTFMYPGGASGARENKALMLELVGQNYVQQGKGLVKCEESTKYVVGVLKKRFPREFDAAQPEWNGYPAYFVLTDGFAGVDHKVRKAFGIPDRARNMTLIEKKFFMRNFYHAGSLGRIYFQPYTKPAQPEAVPSGEKNGSMNK